MAWRDLRLGLLALTAAGLAGCLGHLPLIGLGRDGQPVVTHVDEEAYVTHLVAALSRIQDSVAPVLASHADQKQWRLRTVVVGLQCSATAGIGPFQIGVQPGMRVAFTNGDDPVLP